jgi:hypothetical protein
MADNYSQTSFVLDCGTTEARDDVMLFANALTDPENYEHPDAEGIFDPDEFGGGDISVDGDTALWFCGEESFDMNYFDIVITYAMKKYKLPPMGYTWADTCSKMRTDEFGGGACVYWYDPETDTVKEKSMAGWSFIRETMAEIAGEKA